jgi:endonuclease III
VHHRAGSSLQPLRVLPVVRPLVVARRPPRARHVPAIMRTLAREIDGLELPAVEKISESSQEDPFQVLIGTLLSARTQDATTAAASARQ